jgi:hypothetical protein
LGIVVSNEVLDLGHQLFDAAKSAATDYLLGYGVILGIDGFVKLSRL